MGYKVIRLTIKKGSNTLSTDAAKVIDSLRSFRGEKSKAPTVLVGSGISLWQPTGLPSGQDFTRAMYSLLFDNRLELKATEEKLLGRIFGLIWNREFSGIPFEHLMECCPSEEKANQLINEIYTSRRANPVHEALAGGLKSGLIHSIITTNYDCCLDEALERADIGYTKVATAAQAETYLQNPNLPCYFKIHGSTEPGMEQTPMFSLTHEGLLDPAKCRLLNCLTANRPLILIGYSGLDFEICPEIERGDTREIFWNDLYNEPPSISAGRLLEKKGGYLIYGDMHVFIRHWLGANYLTEKNVDLSNAVKDAVECLFSEEEIVLWQIKTLNSLGLPSFVFKAFSRTEISDENSYFASIHAGRAHFHSGKYKMARRHFRKAVAVAARQKDSIKAADAALEISDAYRSYGAPVRAYLCTWLMDLLQVEILEAKKLIKQSLIIKDFIEITRALKNVSGEKLKNILFSGWIVRSFDLIETKLLLLLELKLVGCAQKALQAGNWIDFQQTALIAEGLDIDIPAILIENYYLPPKATEGYRHLGYYIPQTMVFYDRCLRENRSWQENSNLQREWKRHIKICKMLKIQSSLWKILALSPSEKIKTEARGVFDRCEYGLFKRFFDWKKFAGKS